MKHCTEQVINSPLLLFGEGTIWHSFRYSGRPPTKRQEVERVYHADHGIRYVGVYFHQVCCHFFEVKREQVVVSDLHRGKIPGRHPFTETNRGKTTQLGWQSPNMAPSAAQKLSRRTLLIKVHFPPPHPAGDRAEESRLSHSVGFSLSFPFPLPFSLPFFPPFSRSPF